ncbi:MAG: hypothetical protein GY854_25400 [Deltaproteobacteria bacterium]|nr:hypothetical protein [Deltaproteobacteria bacterium]
MQTLLIITCLLTASCGSAQVSKSQEEEPPALPETHLWQSTVDAVRAMIMGLSIPKHFMSVPFEKDGSEFDVNDYFKVLQHLSLEEGYVLDYGYQYTGLGGFPVVVVRNKEDTEPLVCEKVEVTVRRDENSEPLIGEKLECINGDIGWFARVRTDGTPESFFELVLLLITHDQFYQHWHSNYNDTTIICDQRALEAILLESDPLLAEMQQHARDNPEERGMVEKMINRQLSPIYEFLEETKRIDFSPKVELDSDRVKVSVIQFTKWGGLSSCDYVFSKEAPHKSLSHTCENIAEYNCGIMF